MKDTDIFFSIALMILGIVLMYKSMKGNSCRQILAKLADSIASDKEDINFQIKRFGYLLDEMTADNEKNSILNPELVGGVLEVIRKLAARHMTMLLTTHEMGFARSVADRVIFLADGKVQGNLQ